MNRFIAACLVPMALGGCAIKGEIQGLGQQIPSTVGQLDSVLNGLILQKAIDFHNLVVQLEEIDAAKGIMLEMQPAMPTVGTPITPMPQPVPMPSPAPMPSPSPSPGGPIVTPNFRHGHLRPVPSAASRLQDEWEHSGRPFTGAVAAQ